jgi:serine/threonine protein kinase
MHSFGYVHRDLKSQNILMNLSGHVTVADLGMPSPLIRVLVTFANKVLLSISEETRANQTAAVA